MGRYSFFILSFCYRGHYVYADSSSSDVLLDSSSIVDDSSSGSPIDSESSILDSSGSVQQEESTNTSISEESSEESVSDSLESIDTSYKQDFQYNWVINDFERNQDGIPMIMPRAMWDNAVFGKFTSDNGLSYVNGAFNGWWLSGVWSTDVKALVPAIQNSIWTTNARVDDVRRDLSSSISSLNSVVAGHTTQISNAFSRIATAESNINNLSSSIKSNNNNIVNLWSANSQRIADINALSIANKTNNDHILTLYQQSADTNEKIDGVKTWANSHIMQLYESAASANTNILNLYDQNVLRKAEIADLQKASKTNNDNILALYQQSADTNEKIDGVKTWANSHIMQLYESAASANTNILNLYDQNVLRKAEIADLQKASKTNNDNILALYQQSADTNEKIDGVKTWANSHIMQLYESAASANTNILNLYDQNVLRKAEIADLQKASKTNNDNILALYSQNLVQSNDIAEIKNTLSGFNWSDAGIIAAIIGLHDTWKSKDYMAEILEDDGDAVKLMKSVANKIGSSVADNITLLRNVFGKDGAYWTEYDKRWNNFPLWLQGLLNNYFDHIYNMENKDSLLYRLVYFFIDEMTKTRDFVIEINDNVLIANDSLLLVVDWLKMLYNKPPYSVNVTTPGFDFDRLQQMLDGLNFGNIVNEAGTNIWDFLSELIKTLSDVLGTAISGLTDIAGKILDLLGDLVNQIIKLIVPENLDFLDTGFDGIKSKLDIKFGSFLSLGSQVKEVVQPIDQDFKSVVSIDIMGAKFKPDFALIDWVVVRFRTVMALSIWLSVAIYIYRKITGNGDLINDN